MSNRYKLNYFFSSISYNVYKINFIYLFLGMKKSAMSFVIYNQNQGDIVRYTNSYFNKKQADCSLFSEDGHEFPIHMVSCLIALILNLSI